MANNESMLIGFTQMSSRMSFYLAIFKKNMLGKISPQQISKLYGLKEQNNEEHKRVMDMSSEQLLIWWVNHNLEKVSVDKNILSN